MAAASLALADALTGPPRSAVVAHAGSAGCLLRVGGGSATCDADVVVLLARGGARLPVGVVLPDADRQRLRATRPGERVVIGGCAITLGGRRVAVSRWWDPAIPVLPGLGRAPARCLVAALRHPVVAAPALDCLRPAVRDLSLAMGAGTDSRSARSAASRLIGLGPGLTPAGDDVLCGVLAAVAASGDRAARGPLRGVVTELAPRTTPLSAALLNAAARGQGLPEMSALLRALAGGEPEPIGECLDALGAIGHTSGGAMALGALTALQA